MDQNNNKIIVRISAMAYKKRSNKKVVKESQNKIILFFLLDLFL